MLVLMPSMPSKPSSPQSYYHSTLLPFLFDVSNYSPLFESQPNKRYGTMMQMLKYPFSVGSTQFPAAPSREHSTTSVDQLIIDPNYYAVPGGHTDFLSIVVGQRYGHKICSTRRLADMIVGRVFPPAPSTENGGTHLGLGPRHQYRRLASNKHLRNGWQWREA